MSGETKTKIVMSPEVLVKGIRESAERLMAVRNRIYYHSAEPVGEDDADRAMRAEELLDEANNRLMNVADAVNHTCDDILRIQAMADALGRWLDTLEYVDE